MVVVDFVEVVHTVDKSSFRIIGAETISGNNIL